MKKLLTLLFLPFLIFIISHSPLFSQQQDTTWKYHSVGGFAGVNMNLHSAGFSELPGIFNCGPQFGTGTGIGFGLGALYEIPINQQVRLQFRASYSSLSAKFSLTESIGMTSVKVNGVVSDQPVMDNFTLQSTINAIGFEPEILYPIGDHFKAIGGISTAMLLTANFSQRETIESPANVTFLDNSKIRNDYPDQVIPEKKSLLFSLVLGMGYEMPFGKSGKLVPEVRYFFPLTSITSVSWKPAAFQFGASLKFPLIPAPPPPIRRDTVYQRDTVVQLITGIKIERVSRSNVAQSMDTIPKSDYILHRMTIHESFVKEVPKPNELKASMELFGVFADGSHQENPSITIEETELNETLPLLPFVFFPSGSANLAETRLKYLKPEETNGFKEQNLHALALEIYANNLNIIGSRLRENPTATLTITGCNNNTGVGENSTLSSQRARAIKSYLVDIWGLDKDRLTTKAQDLPDKPASNTSEEGQEENRRSEVASTNYEILKPVVIRDFTKTSTPISLEIKPKVIAEVGLKAWKISVTQGKNTLRNYVGSSPALADQKWEILKNPIPTTEDDVIIKLSTEDKENKQSESVQMVSVKQLTVSKKRSEVRADKRVEIFSLILFDFNKADLSPLNKRIMDVVKKSIDKNSVVTIYGYADRSGSADHNRELAGRRCNEAAQSLKGMVKPENLQVNAVGSDKLIYNNDLPEGRSYSRTVQIVVETPIEGKK